MPSGGSSCIPDHDGFITQKIFAEAACGGGKSVNI